LGGGWCRCWDWHPKRAKGVLSCEGIIERLDRRLRNSHMDISLNLWLRRCLKCTLNSCWSSQGPRNRIFRPFCPFREPSRHDAGPSWFNVSISWGISLFAAAGGALRTDRPMNPGTDWILWGFIYGRWMHLRLVSIYRNHQNIIVIVAVRPNLILGRQHHLSPQIESSVFIFWRNMIYYSENYPFSIAFTSCFQEMFAKGQGVSNNSQGA
jgi:hypothetical protein